MQRVALVTDSSADIPVSMQHETGVIVAPARFGFDDEMFSDGTLTSSVFYARMASEGAAPRPFGASEAAFAEAFRQALDAAESALCLITPFDVSPTFTTASAAVVAMDDPPIRVLNPGVASAGLCSLMTALSPYARAGQPMEVLLAAIDLLEPYCDTLFVPASARWLAEAGRLPLIEDRIGEIAGQTPIVRAGTRITGVSLEETHSAAIERAVQIAGLRAGDGTQIIVTITHADARETATHVADLLQRRWNVVRTIITELSATLGSQLGPGAVGIGVSPARPVRGG
jgi:DegV family protein with EDD domain